MNARLPLVLLPPLPGLTLLTLSACAMLKRPAPTAMERTSRDL